MNSEASFNCTSATLSYTDFPNVTTASPNVVSETVLADGSTALYGPSTFSFTGTAASHTVSISVPAGSHTVQLHAVWNTKWGERRPISPPILPNATCGGPKLAITKTPDATSAPLQDPFGLQQTTVSAPFLNAD
jgi:hypothetical protein